MKKILVVVISIIALATVGFAADYMSDKPMKEKMIFKTSLSGAQSVPAVKTPATGKATFALSEDGKSLKYKVTVKKIENVTAAHIHGGKKGVNAPPIALIKISADTSKKFSGTLAEGTITDAELMTSYKGKTLAELIAAIKTGDTYVNVHTKKNPDGEIRGQLK